MTKLQLFFSMLVSAFLGGFMSLSAYFLYVEPQKKIRQARQEPAHVYSKTPSPINFKQATQKVRSAVVHIKLLQSNIRFQHTELEDTLGGNPSVHYGSGSGVIISADGYIVTNYHVVENAKVLEVMLPDKRVFKAKIVGTDIATDLAVLKIEGKDLPTAQFAPTDAVEVGDWVLAIGNPFDLTTSVTAGIVSGKGRNVNLLRADLANQKNPVESFIQTDAAINPGNSGGALVNMQGEVIGINTAIATHTGYYTGFSFAIPIALVRKVVQDIRKYGETKRAMLGVKLIEVDGKLAERKKLTVLKGVYIDYVATNSSASASGLESGDVILALDQQETNSVPDFNTFIALCSPGQSIKLRFMHKGSVKTADIILRDALGRTEEQVNPKNTETQVMGAEFSLPTKVEKDKLGIKFGVKIHKLQAGKLQNAGIKQGFIITHIDEKAMNTSTEARTALETLKKSKKAITIEGYYMGEGKAYYVIA